MSGANSNINDEEDLMKSIRDYVKANLNTKIAEINTEKNSNGEDFNIDTIEADDGHYVFAGETLDLPNHAFINVSLLETVEIENNKNDKSSKLTVLIEIVFDHPKNANVYFKSMRYMRALYEVMIEYETSTREVDGTEVTKAIPMTVTSASNRRNLVVSGVIVSVTIS